MPTPTNPWKPIDESAWKPVNETSTVSQHPILDTITDFGKGILKGGINTMSGLDDFAAKHLPPIMTTPIGQAPTAENSARAVQYAKDASVPRGTAQSLGKGIEQAGEFLIPGSGEEALTAKLGGGLAARLGTKALGAGVVNAAQGGSFGTGAILGGAGEGLAQGVKAIAPHIAEAALNVAGRDRLYGRTVGDAILNDTTGVRPSTIQASAKDTVSRLAPQVEQLAANAGAAGSRGSLAPARAIVSGTQDSHLLNRAMDSADELSPLASRLTTDARTQLPLGANQSPLGLLAIKRGINSDFITRWKPENQGVTKEAQKVYGALADQFHASAPGTADLDQRISSLIPVIDRAGAASNAASTTQNVLHKFKAPTGALTGAFAGGTAGYEQSHSLGGALAGAAVGAVAPAIVANPTSQMVLARSLYSPALSRTAIPLALGTGLQLGRKDRQ